MCAIQALRGGGIVRGAKWFTGNIKKKKSLPFKKTAICVILNLFSFPNINPDFRNFILKFRLPGIIPLLNPVSTKKEIFIAFLQILASKL